MENTATVLKGSNVEEYITIDELCKRTKYARQTVYNMINKKIFFINQHYYKPTSKKILFKWSAIESWLSGGNVIISNPPEIIINNQQVQKKKNIAAELAFKPLSTI